MAYPQFTPEELETEEWREVEGFGKPTEQEEVTYYVSNLGRVVATSIFHFKPATFGRTENDYTRVTLQKRGKNCAASIHRLVAKAFIGEPPEDKPQVNHKNGVKYDNRLTNLEYKSAQGNSQHAFDTGLSKRGEGMGTAKLTDAQVTEIIQRLAAGEIGNDIAKDYPVSGVIISLIRRNKIWTHLPRPDGLADPLAHWAKLHPERLKYGDNNPSRSHYDLIPKGEDSHNAKITEDDVRNIRKLYASGDYYMRELADTFSISLSQTKRIIDRETWKQVD